MTAPLAFLQTFKSVSQTTASDSCHALSYHSIRYLVLHPTRRCCNQISHLQKNLLVPKSCGFGTMAVKFWFLHQWMWPCFSEVREASRYQTKCLQAHRKFLIHRHHRPPQASLVSRWHFDCCLRMSFLRQQGYQKGLFSCSARTPLS